MRVLALGGAGGMGRHLCRAALHLNGVDELIVADLNAPAADAFARELGARGIGLDVTDSRALSAALSGVDVVVNTVGPFFRFGVPILTAAIDAGCHYLDICDDWEPTLDMLGLNDRARAAGVTAVIGMGATPGLSNLLAVLAARELDTTDEVITGWNIEAGGLDDTPGPEVSAAVVHGITQMTGTIRVLRGGRMVDEPPLRRTVLDYPGLGRRTAWTFGHPEPITLPHTIDTATTSVNVTVGSRPFIAFIQAIRWAVDHGLMSPRSAARMAQTAEHRWPSPPMHKQFTPDRLPPLFALAKGIRNGHPAAAAVALRHYPGTTMGAVTGIPLAVALELCTTNALTTPGVFAPEAIIDPDQYLTALATHCPTNPSPQDMTITTRSWDPNATTTYRDGIHSARTAAALHI
ncbi:saccharopine dehydrogenase family protein [Actinocrispum wychmicini]|uniref:Saccharopine dehydrogenase-like NADP-dependent oxidoreductase n=1 Tax=Actinocrispum wychmicini TaxID=1213861 RepID=A0A4V2S5U0_9PSEU|nr:saccharopine dehydrogenase NADP-binding domain-containing protein [Actinocrispum wychmicini]TCO53460.1 saccharopine dehydrogenase-like NADP-dependent oxidoreductase [Actinocrispum wychmicini]